MDSNKKLSWCSEGRHKSTTVKKNEKEKVNHKLKKNVRVVNGKSYLRGRRKSHFFTK